MQQNTNHKSRLINLIEKYIDNSLKIIVKNPSEYTKEEIKLFNQLVLSAGEVISTTLSSNIKRCHLLGFLYIGNEVASIGAIKKPRDSYKEYITMSSGIDITLYDNEIGYLFTSPNHRKKGNNEKLVKEMLNKTRGSVFATIKSQNIASKKLFDKIGFKNIESYKSTNGNYFIDLYIKG